MAKKCFKDVMENSPNGTPKTNADIIMSRLTKECSIDTTTSEARVKLRKQISSKIHYDKKNNKKGNGLVRDEDIRCLGDDANVDLG